MVYEQISYDYSAPPLHCGQARNRYLTKIKCLLSTIKHCCCDKAVTSHVQTTFSKYSLLGAIVAELIKEWLLLIVILPSITNFSYTIYLFFAHTNLDLAAAAVTFISLMAQPSIGIQLWEFLPIDPNGLRSCEQLRYLLMQFCHAVILSQLWINYLIADRYSCLINKCGGWIKWFSAWV